MHEYKLITTKNVPSKKYDAIVLTVSHKEFLKLDLQQFRNNNAVIYDVKGILKDKLVKRL
jgi:UDP-N-acetyl-D-glucosamine/UDP-N-acetyl-D-galactosamine dehydrogenase